MASTDGAAKARSIALAMRGQRRRAGIGHQTRQNGIGGFALCETLGDLAEACRRYEMRCDLRIAHIGRSEPQPR